MLLFQSTVFGQAPRTPDDFGLRHFTIKDSALGKVNFYVTKNGIQTRKPLLVLLDGSGHLPLYALLKKTDGSSQIIGTVPFRYNSLSRQYHVVLISKPGTPFMDSLNVDSHRAFTQQYIASEEYNQKLSLEWRAHSASSVINFLLDTLDIDTSNVTAIGYSEGGQVVPKLALLNNKVTKIVNIVGGGLNQFYDFITAERLKAARGTISQDSAQANIDSLLQKFKDIYQYPHATHKFWLGHTYQRWASFCKDTPLENMLQLDIPILIVTGGEDTNSPITGLDYVPLEFIRKGKKNLTYKVYPNCDHWFNNQVSSSSQLQEMMAYVFHWVDN